MTVPVLINAPEQSVSDVVVGYYTIFTQRPGAKIERLTGQPCLLSVNNSSDWGSWGTLPDSKGGWHCQEKKREPLLTRLIKGRLNISE